MSSRFGVPFDDVRVRTDAHAASLASRAGAQAYATRNEIGFAPGAYQPHTSSGRLRIAHEFAHVAQFRGGNSSSSAAHISSQTAAEWQARNAASASLGGGQPAISPFTGPGPLYDKGPIRLKVGNDEEFLKGVLRTLDTVPRGEQRGEAVTLLVDFAMTAGPLQFKAQERVASMLAGIPVKNIADQANAIDRLERWAHQDPSAYNLLLLARMWTADHSKNELGSELARGPFQHWLHQQGGRPLADFLRRKAASPHFITANLGARMTADLLAHENDPGEARYRRNYEALRKMALANGWESFGAMGAASATPRIFSALAGIRDEANQLVVMLRRGPVGDAWEDADVVHLNQTAWGLDTKGPQVAVGPQGNPIIEFSAENQEETEGMLLKGNPTEYGAWLQEMARAYTIAVAAGAHLEGRTQILQDNARALNDFLGADAARQSDEEQALFQLRHDYTEAWLSIFGTTFKAGTNNVSMEYQRRLDEVEDRFQHFDHEIAQTKFTNAHKHFMEYAQMFDQGNDAFSDNRKVDASFFYSMKRRLTFEKEDLTSRFTTTWGTTGGPIHISSLDFMPPGHTSKSLREVSQLASDSSIFGLQAGIYLIYASNLNLHGALLASSIGSSSFRADQGKLLSDDRQEMEASWAKNDFEGFLKKSDAYTATIKSVVQHLQHREKLDKLISIGITLIAALVTEGVGLAVRLATLSEIASVARTAEALSSVSTLMDAGVFTAADLTMEHAVFGRDFTAGEVIKEAGANLIFFGGMKILGKFIEPLAKGSAIRKLVLRHILGFSGVAAVSATRMRIETGHWPADMTDFLIRTGATYLLLVGMHAAFETMAKPILTGAFRSKLESLNADNEALYNQLQERVNSGTLEPEDFEKIRKERIRLVEEAREIAKIIRNSGLMTDQEFSSVNQAADNAVAGAHEAVFPGSGAGNAAILALPAPESVLELTRVGDTDTYAYDPSKSSASREALLTRYKDKGFKIEGNAALTRVVDPDGRTRFTLTSAPVASTRLFPAEFSPPPHAQMLALPQPAPLERATGLSGPDAAALHAELAKINPKLESTLTTEYPDQTVLSTLAMVTDMRSRIEPNWPIDAVRGLADAVSLERAIPRSAVRRLFMAIDEKRLPTLLAHFHDIVNSSKVSPGGRFLIADNLLPKESATLIDAFRALQARRIELPADMDERAVRGLANHIEKSPGGWLRWLASTPKAKRGERLRAEAGPADPGLAIDPLTALPASARGLLEDIGADLPGYPGINLLGGPNGDAVVQALEKQATAGKFSDPRVRDKVVRQIDQLRLEASLLQQGAPPAIGKWSNIVGDLNEVQRAAALLLAGDEIVGVDERSGRKLSALPNIGPSLFPLPGGAKVINAPSEKTVHIDFLYKEAKGTLTALETTTGKLFLPEALKSLDPKDPDYGKKDIDWLALHPESDRNDRKFAQAIKIYQLGKMAHALGVSWSGGPIDPAKLIMSAGDFDPAAARALENLGFVLELKDGSAITAAQIEARKTGSTKP